MAYTSRTSDSVSSRSTMSTNSTPAVSSRAPRTPYQLKKVPCNKEGCQYLFDTLEEMKYHKKGAPDHFYCKRCDFDAEDWESLTAHKVEVMAPYVEGVAGKVKKPDSDLKHIVCEFCGHESNSFGGRKRHRQQLHPADQDITCPGCQGKFIRAHHLVGHLEHGDCTVISARTFHGKLQQKYIVSQIMAAPDKAFKPPKLLNGKAAVPSSGSVTDGSEALDHDTGGVSLMDQEDEAQLGGYRPMEAEKNLIDLFPQQNHEKWPRIPTQSSAPLTESLHSMSIHSKSIPASKKNSGGVSLGGSTTRSGDKVYTESYPYLSSPQAASVTEEEDDDDDTISESTVTSASAMGAGAWGTSQTSRALFPSARPTPRAEPKAGDWEGILAQRAAEAESNTGADMLKIAWWDPTSKDYDIERFKHPVYEAYFCPFPACEDAMCGNSFDSQADIEFHIKYCHTRSKFRCNGCFKHFNSATQLVAHAESTRKCGIKDSKMFEKFLDEITGGFLKSKYVGEPKIYRPETAMVKQGAATGGIASTKFTAKQPWGR